MVDLTLRVSSDAAGIADELDVGAEALAGAMEAAGLTADAVCGAAGERLLGWVCDMVRNRDYDLAGDLADILGDGGVDAEALLAQG